VNTLASEPPTAYLALRLTHNLSVEDTFCSIAAKSLLNKCSQWQLIHPTVAVPATSKARGESTFCSFQLPQKFNEESYEESRTEKPRQTG
jgi:hypothetical protein